ncbi:MAG: Fis family transcriptional regulator [Betaproteobacteria bacterium RIFCSPLOWO2_02_FULL_63_19]|nr:MAG: Fis family transcriptional regulator [Betaproteobacteria bacterium RIFCSPLOWO2_02_FULL_63_19]
METVRLSGADRGFFAALAEVAFRNPFSAERAQLIKRLAPDAELGDLTKDREALARVVMPRIETLLRAGAKAVEGLSTADRALIEPALLYVCYHRHVPAIDALIERQAATGGGAPSVVPFANELIGDLVQCAFAEEVAVRYLALFYQLRRAFYFIHRSLVGDCESMRRLRQALWNNVFTHDMRGYNATLWSRMEDFSTLLLGETGTGKGAAAAAIGRSAFIPYVPNERRFAANFADTFISINLSQFPEQLIESELFGHRKGSFTGAIENHEGVFGRCSPHGALFLDEIGEVSVPVQIKLLQVLQERSFTPLGGHDKRRFSGRVIAATNRRLSELRSDGGFRDDFYYRLCTDVIEVPTLRERLAESPAELNELVGQLVTRIADNDDAALAANVLDSLQQSVPRGYSWPGNVRELEQAVRRVLLAGRYQVEPVPAIGDEETALAEAMRAGTLTADELLGGYCALLHRRLGTYAEVAKRTELDARTVRKYVESAKLK